MRTARVIGIRYPLRGGQLKGTHSNIKKLEEDFARQISFGKAPPPANAEKIRKKFSI
jgi:hypothetical protein